MRAVGFGDLGVVASDGLDGACLHGGQGLATGEDRGAGFAEDRLPERFLRQLGELSVLPVAVVAFGDPGLDGDLCGGVVGAGSAGGDVLVGEDGVRGLSGALQRAGDDPGERDGGEAFGGTPGLVQALVVEEDARGASGEDPGGVRGAAPVADEDDGGHRDEDSRDGCRHVWNW